MNATQEQLQEMLKCNVSEESLATLQAEIDKQGDLELTTTAIYCISRVLAEPRNLPIVKLVKLGDNIQTLEHVCAKLKKLILDIKVPRVKCHKCNQFIPEMRMEMMLNGVNKDCPHDKIEIIETIVEADV